METPETRYTRSGDVNIAYQVVGDGDVDLLWIPGFAQHVELNWEEPVRRAFLEQLAAEFRLILFDKRGTGLSDRVGGAQPVEARMDDCRAVLDAVGSTSAVVFAAGDAADLAVVFAATYPDRVSGLALYNGRFRGAWAPDWPWARPREEQLRSIEEMERRWPASLTESLSLAAPSLDPRQLDAFARVNRLSVSPGAAAAFSRMTLDSDVRQVLPSVLVPTVVMHGVPSVEAEGSKWAASRLPRGEYVAIERPDVLPTVGNTVPIIAEVRRLVARVAETPDETDRILATVLFTDLVDSTAQSAAMGDKAWRSVIAGHHAAVREQLARFRGVEHDTAGDGFFASFDGPARAIRCAVEIRRALGELGLEVRAGIHTGECEMHDGKVAGIAVAIGARVASRATAGEVLVSQTVKDLVAGSGISFDDRGTNELKGVPGEWRLYAVAAGA